MNEAFYPTVVVELSDEEGGGFAAYAPDLPGCIGDGESPSEALADLQNAVLEWTDEASRLGRVIPLPGSAVKSRNRRYERLIELVEKQHEAISQQSEVIGEQGDLLKRQGHLLDELSRLAREMVDAAESQSRRDIDLWPQLSAERGRGAGLLAIISSQH